MATMDKRLAVVTGGNKGIGYEICRQLARKGLRVVLTSRDAEKGREARKKLEKEGLDVLHHQLEVTDQASAAAIARYIENEYGRVVNLSSGLGQLDDMGDGTPAYRVSKTALNALTRMVAKAVEGDNILVNSMCPGWVRTDMGGPGASRSVEQGAETAVWLAMLPHDGPTGGFFRDKKPIPW
jgi:NAD(P)-dependent dehydrogenase (short-subunit alcohol dehydrogenase family)